MVNDLFPRSVMVLTVGGHHHESPQQRSRSQWQWRSLITQDTHSAGARMGLILYLYPLPPSPLIRSSFYAL